MSNLFSNDISYDSSHDIAYDLIYDNSYNNIQNNIKKYINISHQIRNQQIEGQSGLRQYAKVCIWLINIIDSLINKMNESHKYTISEKFTGNDQIYGLAYITEIQKHNLNYFLAEWKKNNAELPFHFIKKLFENKGYIIDVQISGYREDLYAEWTNTYLLVIKKNRIRQRE